MSLLNDQCGDLDMAKYTVNVRLELWHTLLIETDLTDLGEIENWVYDMTDEQERDAIIETELHLREVYEIELQTTETTDQCK
jgi:hypothetical protein